MTLSEQGEKGRKTAARVSAVCFVISALADISVLAVIAFVFRKYGAVLPIPYIGVFGVIAITALLDITALFTLIFSRNASAYFHEISDKLENIE